MSWLRRPACTVAALSCAEPSPLLQHSTWDEERLASAGVTAVDAPIVSVGGGLGSFALVHLLRVTGLPTLAIRVLSNRSTPHESFAALAGASQLGLLDRLRSDSSSRIDNLWGWPGYALTEALAERTLAPLWKVLTEPLFSEHFTPRVRTVTAGLEREAARIGWNETLVRCWAQVVRRRTGGGYFVLVQPLDDQSHPIAVRCKYVHLALGYPGPRLLPDLLTFRERYRDARHVVNGYEPHEDIYEQLVRSPGRVLLRGAGITASRILERLVHDRDHLGARTEILHVFRNYVRGPTGPPWFRRRGRDGFAYQPFNFPKAAGGGQLRQRTLALSGDERARLIMSMGGTTTAWRPHWQQQLARGRREGWYQVQAGTVTGVWLSASGRLSASLSAANGSETQVQADFLIDATGLEDSIRQHALLADLLNCGGASTNALGRLDVEPTFEVRGTRSGAGRLYASGAATLGSSLAPVDSFWGLIHAAMEICDDLADQGVCEFPGAFRSITQWWRWVRNEPP